MIETAFELKDINDELKGYVCRIKHTPEDNNKLYNDARPEDEEHNADYLCNVIKKACIKFGKRYKNPEARLLGIMNNVIKNQGVFTPM